METNLVRKWMSQNLVTIGPDATLLDACKQMHGRCIRRLPVVDSEGKLIGIVTRGDIREAWPSAVTAIVHELNLLLQSQPVSLIMTHHPITVTPDTSVEDAARLMLSNKIDGLPVVEGDRLVGIITSSDVFRLVVESHGMTTEHPVPDVT